MACRADRGTRLDNYIARLFHISVKQLLAIRKAGRAHLQEPLPRGRRPQEEEEQTEDPENQTSSDALDSRPNALPKGIVATIPGAYCKSPSMAENCTIAIILGRMMFQTLVSTSVHSAYTGRVLQAYLAGAPVGQKHHDHHALSALSYAGTALLRGDLRSQFHLLPEACKVYKLPRCWGAEVGSVTLHNGVTLLPVFVHYTDANGAMMPLERVVCFLWWPRSPKIHAPVCKVRP